MKYSDTADETSPEPKGVNLFGVDPLIIQDHYEIDYRHSYAQDSSFFVGLSKGDLLGSRCTSCHYMYATPRSHCMECGSATTWEKLPLTGHIHTFTVCYYGGESFLKETPFILVLVEFKKVDTLFLSRLKGIAPEEVHIGLPIRPRFTKTPTFKVTDVWFEPMGLP
ncbi:MAG: Zn-ribbon domain-containing OB-fold protein [Nitrospirales bacterium]|nr:Zn-ribbon domain-containing OB-fold protein [Nitrospirales bacterium]MDR4482930.1 Zn-ribbon domain-containing OB-fold protein [Nitrospirales bacterium]